jgi:hypothetical protein
MMTHMLKVALLGVPGAAEAGLGIGILRVQDNGKITVRG